MSLDDWAANGWLLQHQTSRAEIADLLAVADRDLADAQVAVLSADWRLSIAYNAALQLAVALLAAAGYRAAREAHHYRVIQSLAYSLRWEADAVTQLDAFRKKRNIGGYERAGSISEQEAREMLALAQRLRREAGSWLRAHHPRLL